MPIRPPLDGVLETALVVEDVARAIRFYTGIFGFEVMVQSERLGSLNVKPAQVLLLFQRGGSLNDIQLPGGILPGGMDAQGRSHMAFAIPAAYAMAFHPTQRTRGTLLWMLSTKMLPPVGVLVPIYLLFRTAGLLDTRSGLVMIYALMNLPIVVWMLFTFYKEVPNEILEAGRMDGAKTAGEVWFLLLPLTLPGVASTGLLSLILCWNEAFWSLNLTSAGAAPLTAFIASFSSPEGLFFAKLSAASTMAVAPILVFGWFSQRQLVQGLTFGAVK